MKKSVLFVGAEAMPFAATGGLGDVLGSLPTALAAEGADVRVVMPLYSAVGAQWREQMTTEAVFTVELAWRRQYCGILSLKKDGVTYYFVDNEYYFDRAGGLIAQPVIPQLIGTVTNHPLKIIFTYSVCFHNFTCPTFKILSNM